MSYRRFRGDQMFTGFEMLGKGHTLITTEAGQIVEIIPEAFPDAEYFPGILSPGFVNAHCHLELAHMKGLIPERTGLTDFVYKVVTERHFPEDVILSAIEEAERSMIENGIVAIGDICNNTSTLTQKRRRNLRYYNFIEASGWNPAVASQRFERSLEFYNSFFEWFDDTSIVPHAPYSVSEELWELISPYFSGTTVSLHNQETEGENEFFIRGTGPLVDMYKKMNIDNSFFVPSKRSSIAHTFTKLEKASEVILVHNTFTTQEDIDLIKTFTPKHQHVSFCLCINANQYIENAIPPVELLRKNNCDIVIGTDSIASNWSLSILDEIITLQKNFRHIETRELLKWGTLNGAIALGMQNELGSFEKGKTPGLININGLEQNASGRRSLPRLQRIL